MQYIQTEQKDTKNEMEGKEFQGEAWKDAETRLQE